MLVVQRTSSDLRLNPHVHAVFLDGVHYEDEGGEVKFHALPRLETEDVAGAVAVDGVVALADARRHDPVGEALIIRPAKLSKKARIRASTKKMMAVHDETLPKLAK